MTNKYESLKDEVQGKGVDGDWQVLQEVLVGAASVIILKERKRRKKDWVTEQILDMMEERRRYIYIELYIRFANILKSA